MMKPIAGTLSIRDHVWAAIDDTPKTTGEIRNEVNQYMDFSASRQSICNIVLRAVKVGVAVQTECGRYIEPQDHFCESRMVEKEEVAA
jgi:hypothetical protein